MLEENLLTLDENKNYCLPTLVIGNTDRYSKITDRRQLKFLSFVLIQRYVIKKNKIFGEDC